MTSAQVVAAQVVAAQVVMTTATARVRQLQRALSADIVAEGAAGGAVVVWAEPWLRTVPVPVIGQAVHVVDLHGVVAACPGWGAVAQAAWCTKVAGLCRGAALLLVGSAAEHGYWSALLARAGVTAPVAMVPYAAPDAAPDAAEAGVDGMLLTGGLTNPALRVVLDGAVAWARAQGIAIRAEAEGDPLTRLASARLGLVSSGNATRLLLDLREDTPAERVSAPAAVVNAIAQGVPVLTTVEGVIGQAIADAGGGRVLGPTFEPPGDLGAMAAAALALAATWPSEADAGGALHAAIQRAVARCDDERKRWRRGGGRLPQPLGPDGHVLVISDESANLGAVRVHLPFGALHRRGAIAGYAVMRDGEVSFDTRASGAAQSFSAVWVHRSMEPGHRLLLELLGCPFAYDVDDNLLTNPTYRESFHPIAMQSARDMLQSAAAVSCATPRLARLLSSRADIRLADRLVITPNLAQERPMVREAGPPRALIWASSDRPALTGSKGAIVRAVRDHCLAHRVKLVCIGAPPPEELARSGVELEAVGLLPHSAYREYLSGLSPAILVCPLETNADGETQDFIDGKSDIKVLEALSFGLVGVFSRARPYCDTDFAAAILCDNTYEAWLDGLEAARAACLAPTAPPPWPDARDSAGFGLAPWASALARVRLPTPLPLAEVREAVAAVAALERRPIVLEEFDEEYYLDNYPDVRLAVTAGQVRSGYEHYAESGRAERRYARRLRSPVVLGDTWWGTLLYEVGRLEAGTARRAERIAVLERQMALRRMLTSGSA